MTGVIGAVGSCVAYMLAEGIADGGGKGGETDDASGVSGDKTEE
ncbi:hypothetical protein [Paenibacillus timonensis]